MSDLSEPSAMRRMFARRTSIEQVEEGAELAPKFDAEGLIVCVTTDAANGDVLMVGTMNAEALSRTIATGEAHYWSRSRQTLWYKGATSGLTQRVHELRIDDDQDAVACEHRGRWGELPCGLSLVFLPARAGGGRACQWCRTGVC